MVNSWMDHVSWDHVHSKKESKRGGTEKEIFSSLDQELFSFFGESTNLEFGE